MDQPVPSMKVLSVVGTRPNFVKLFSVHRALRSAGVPHTIVHTGQHFDVNMSDVFFRDLELPDPDVHLEIEPSAPVLQTAHVLERFEPVLRANQPDWVVVYGDVTSTPAAALAARLMGIRSAHVEAGYRSFDRAMPEEINRVVTDHISDLLLAPDETAAGNLRSEGVHEKRIRIVGSTNIDALFFLKLKSADPIRPETPRLSNGISRRNFLVVTLHRPSNVDDSARLQSILETFADIAADVPVILPLHPRTRARMSEAGISMPPGIQAMAPLPYREFLALVSTSRAVFTDSGGLQEECAVLGVPCIVMRDTSERPALVTAGHTRLVGGASSAIRDAWNALKSDGTALPPYRDALTDGRTGDRIVEALQNA